MDPQSSAPSEQDSAAKKANPFDNLGRDDLIKKCRGLLGIAQKAKQAKDECLEENRKLKEQLAQTETQKTADKECLRAMQEIVESLTQQKLAAAMKVDELEKSVAGLRRELDGAALLREQLERISVENEAFRRQIDRLTEENEQLLGDLSGMEEKFKSSEQEQESLNLSKANLEQELEKVKSDTVTSGKEEKLIRKLKLYKNKVQEISAKILLLKSDRKILLKTVKEYSEQVPKWQKELVNASNVLFAKTQQFEKENYTLKEKCVEYERELEELRKGGADGDESKGDLVALQSRFETLQLDHQSLNDKLHQVLKDKTILQEQLNDSRKEFDETHSQMAINEKLQKRLAELEENLSEKSEELAESKKYLESLQQNNCDLEARIHGYEEKIKQCEIDNKKREASFKTQCDEFEQQINVINGKWQQAISEKEDLDSKARENSQNEADYETEFRNKLNVLEDQISTKTEELSEINQKFEEQRNTYESKLTTLQEELDKSQKSIASLNSELLQAQEKLRETVQKMNEDFQERLTQEQKVHVSQHERESNVLTSLANLQELYQNQVNELQEANAKISVAEEFKKKCQLLQTDVAERDSELATLRESLEQTTSALQTLQVQHQELMQEGTTAREELSTLQSKFELVQQNKIDLEARIHGYAEKIQQCEIEKKNREATFKTQCDEFEQHICATKAKLQQAISEKQEQKVQTSQNERESNVLTCLADLQELYQNQVSELQAANAKISVAEEFQKKNQLLQTDVAERDSELATLRESVEQTSATLQTLQVQHQELTQEGTTTREELGTLQSKFELVKLENSELLSELKEINEILKERGGVISLQLSRISELEVEKGTLQQQITEHEQRVAELERTVTERDLELNALRERSFDAQSDVMSTSTISRAEEAARMRDVDDSFEEKYIKLRALAVKLKKKVAEQTILLQRYEKEGLGKNLQSLQAENDKLLDELEAERKNVEELQQEIETLNQLRTEVDSSKKDKSSLESSIREYREQVQSLKREKEAFNLAKKEIDAENQKLKVALKAKEKQLADELEAQKELKAEVEKSRLAAKKANLLNLEMEAYEKSLAELNKKLEAKKGQVKEMESTLEVQEGTIKSLKSQMTLMEQSLASERGHSQELKKNVDVQQEKLRLSEHQRGETNVELAQLKMDYETIKLEIESNRLELSNAITEKEKVSSGLETEKSRLVKQVYSLESTVDDLKAQLKEREQEVEDVKAEFASYKLRAQSVLRQNQNKDSGKELELQEEVKNLQKALDISQTKLQNVSQQMAEAVKSCEELRFEKTRLQTRSKELHDLLEESRLQHESMLEDGRRANLNHQEALKTQRLQNETLVNCYKKQLDELQEKHSQELATLQSRLSHTGRDVSDNNNYSNSSQQSQRISDEQKINLLLMEREEGEGSESTSSQNANAAPARRKISNSSQPRGSTANRSARDLIPLDELLNSSFDDTVSVFGDTADDSSLRAISPGVEMQQTKEKLGKQESRVRHLTALLAEAEQDLAKLNQLNELLKEEVRRQERSIEREKHAHNSEYLKNVIFKFLTLNSGDEKSRLVPVLNTILRLSPEETQKLNNVAKGSEGGVRGWTGILWN